MFVAIMIENGINDNDILKLVDTDLIKLFKDGSLTDVDASVVNECHFAIFLNDSYYSTKTKSQAFVDAMNGKCLIFTDSIPQYLKELAIGYCYCNADFEPENISQVMMAEADEESVVAIVFVDDLLIRAKGPKVDHHIAYNTNTNQNIAFKPEKLIKEMKIFATRSELNRITGAVHAAEIFDGQNAIRFIEDVSNTNAIYKAIGYSLTYGIDMSGCILLTSGKIMKENVRACYLSGCRVLVSYSPPTRQAIEYAMEKDVTLICFGRNDTFRIYCGWERIMI